jgi:hypothetical protein
VCWGLEWSLTNSGNGSTGNATLDAQKNSIFLDFGYLMFMPGPQINVNECYLNS